MTAMAFFTGIDGLDCWNWSGTGNHHVASFNNKAFGDGQDFNVGKTFTAVSDGGTKTTFRRDDAYLDSVLMVIFI